MNSTMQNGSTATSLLNPADVLFPKPLTTAQISEMGKEVHQENVIPVFPETIDNSSLIDHLLPDVDQIHASPLNNDLHAEAASDALADGEGEQVDTVVPVTEVQDDNVTEELLAAPQAPVEDVVSINVPTDVVEEDAQTLQAEDGDQVVVDEVTDTAQPVDLGQQIEQLWQLDHIDIGMMEINLAPVQHAVESSEHALPLNQIWKMTSSMMHIHLNNGTDSDTSTEIPMAQQLLTLAENSMAMLNPSKYAERPAAQPSNSVM
jgi:hypothetical protein